MNFGDFSYFCSKGDYPLCRFEFFRAEFYFCEIEGRISSKANFVGTYVCRLLVDDILSPNMS